MPFFFRSHKISVLGAGSWGTTIANLLSEKGHKVTIWTFEENVVREINENHTNSNYLPGIKLEKNLKATSLPASLWRTEIFVNAIPTQFIREAFSKYKFPIKNKIIVNLSKGIEKKSLMRISGILQDTIGFHQENYLTLTGPSHAEEVSRKIPTAVVVASENIESAKLVRDIFSTSYFRVYSSEDVIGCELGGALKNVIAVAAGIIDGLNFGDNTKAALITRGLAEITKLGVALGAKHQTFSGLSGLGDLVVTCNSKHSRNRYVGEQIGKGKQLQEILKEMKMVAEGIQTTESAYFLSQQHKVDMPIIEHVYKILFNGLEPIEAINNLMTRQTKNEWWW